MRLVVNAVAMFSIVYLSLVWYPGFLNWRAILFCGVAGGVLGLLDRHYFGKLR